MMKQTHTSIRKPYILISSFGKIYLMELEMVNTLLRAGQAKFLIHTSSNVLIIYKYSIIIIIINCFSV